MGFENLVFSRIDNKEKVLRKKKLELEFFWRPYFSYDKGRSKIFTHITSDHYNPPSSLKDLVQNVDFIWNIDQKAKDLINWLIDSKNLYRTNHIMILLGDDFTFKSPNSAYLSVERIIDYINNHPEYSKITKLFYSNTETYFNALHQSDVIFPSYNDLDFYPYSDGKKIYWTGFFTSRPYLKRLTRIAGSYLASASKYYVEELIDRKINNKISHE